MRKNTRRLLSLFVVLLLFFAPNAYALVNKDEARTKIGNPVSSASSLIGASLDIKLAYESCTGGGTFEQTGLTDCLREFLATTSHSATYRDTFLATRPSTLTDRGCTECLGFVRLAATLAHGGGDGLALANASAVVPLSSFSAGGITYRKISASDSLQAGDIGAHGGGDGHIVIVNEPLGNVKFTALESNGNFDCRITDNRQILRDGYSFFRIE